MTYRPILPMLATASLALLVATGCTDAPAAEAGAGDGAATPDPARAIIAATAETDPDLAAELEEIYEATVRYRDLDVALADGYVRSPVCSTAEMEGVPRQAGGMGIHVFRPDLLGITQTEPRVSGTGTHTDFRHPGVLVYEPQPDGSFELVAVESLVFRDAWRAAGNEEVPEFMGNQYYARVDNPLTDADEAHGFEPHYELHLWLYRENPSGLFAQFNPNATCRHYSGGSSTQGH